VKRLKVAYLQAERRAEWGELKGSGDVPSTLWLMTLYFHGVNEFLNLNETAS